MIRPCRFRALISIMLTFLMLGMSAWSYGGDDAADAIPGTVAAFSLPDGGTGPHAGDIGCGHGCHAQSHITAIEHESVSVHASPAQGPIPLRHAARTPPFRTADGPFRPPRLLAHA